MHKSYNEVLVVVRKFREEKDCPGLHPTYQDIADRLPRRCSRQNVAYLVGKLRELGLVQPPLFPRESRAVRLTCEGDELSYNLLHTEVK